MTGPASRRDILQGLAGLVGGAATVAAPIVSTAAPAFDPDRWHRDLIAFGGATYWDDETQSGGVVMPLYGKSSPEDRAMLSRLSNEMEANRPAIRALARRIAD